MRLPESRKCFCDCCTCGDDAKEVPSKYERSSFFSIQPFACNECENKPEAVDYDSAEDSERIREKEDAKNQEEEKYELVISSEEDENGISENSGPSGSNDYKGSVPQSRKGNQYGYDDSDISLNDADGGSVDTDAM